MAEKQGLAGMRNLILPEILDLLAGERNSDEIRSALEDFAPVDIAELVPELANEAKARLFSALTPDFAAEVFENLPQSEQLAVVERLRPGRAGAILDEVEPDDRADFLSGLPEETINRFLSVMEKRSAEETSELLQYPPHTAGGLMTTRFLAVRESDTVARALASIRREGSEVEEIYNIYVTGEAGRLVGTVSLRSLVLAEPGVPIGRVMEPEPVSVPVDQDQEVVASEIKKYDLVTVPVVDERGRLKGVISVDDVIDVITEEQTEDVYRMGAAATGAVPEYATQNPLGIVRHRIFWLILLVVLGFFSGFIIERYEQLMQAFVALAFFIPLLMDTGGNAGTQASTVVIRGLATGEVKMKDIRRVVGREMVAGLLAGAILGLLSITRVFALRQGLTLAVVVALAMLATITIATTLGALLPLFCKRVGVDPAVVSSPLITTLLDVSALIIYFELARSLLTAI